MELYDFRKNGLKFILCLLKYVNSLKKNLQGFRAKKSIFRRIRRLDWWKKCNSLFRSSVKF